ncbi:hypothetical protein LINPERHAP2_LOCUS30292 [Linum perenne]
MLACHCLVVYRFLNLKIMQQSSEWIVSEYLASTNVQLSYLHLRNLHYEVMLWGNFCGRVPAFTTRHADQHGDC